MNAEVSYCVRCVACGNKADSHRELREADKLAMSRNFKRVPLGVGSAWLCDVCLAYDVGMAKRAKALDKARKAGKPFSLMTTALRRAE